jgi:hypothetical protein
MIDMNSRLESAAVAENNPSWRFARGHIFSMPSGRELCFCMIGLTRLPGLAVPHTASSITLPYCLRNCLESISQLAVFPFPWAPLLIRLPICASLALS